MKKEIQIVLLIFMLSVTVAPGLSFGQQKSIEKLMKIETIVKDADGNPLSGAIVYGKDGAVRVTTNSSGYFLIEVPKSSELRIHANGYNDVVTNNVDPLQGIVLLKSSFLMGDDDVVNLPFTKVKRRELVGSVSTVNPQDFIRFDNSQFAYDAIQGRVPGLLGNSNIRGIGNALIIVDGVQRDPSNINLDEVEQITVLKDQNAAMMYGSSAKNGVILFTTKRGEAYKRKINVSIEQGLSSPLQLPKYLNSADYMERYNEALVNDGMAQKYSDTDIAKYRSGENIYRYPNVDYYSSEYLKKTSNFTKVFTEFSGGNNTTQYYANVGWNHNGSLYNLGEGKNTASNRFNVRGNVNFKLNDLISSYVDAVVVFDVTKGPRGNFWNDAATLAPNYYAPLIPASLVKDQTILDAAKLVNGEFILGGTSQYLNNVHGNMFLSGSTQSIRRTAQFNTGIDFDLKKISQGLKFKTYLSFDIYNKYEQNVSNTYAVYQPTWGVAADTITSLKKLGSDQLSGVQALENADFERVFGFYGMLDYQRTFNNIHHVTGMLLGYVASSNLENYIQADRSTHLGLRLTYDYDKKYFVDFSSTMPYSSKFQGKERFGFSPSLGLSWIVSEADWWQSNLVDYLKIRASAGTIQSDINLNYFYADATYRNEGSFTWNDAFYSNSYTYIDRAANPNLGYEKSKTINLGFESYLFGKKLYLDMNTFHTLNSGLVVRRNMYYPGYMGPNYPYQNFGENSYTGLELAATWSQNLGDFSFELGANMLYSTSKVLKSNELWANDYQYRTGKPVNAIFGLESQGLFSDISDITSSPEQKFGEVRPGDIKYKDQNDDGIIDANDQVYIGKSQAPFSYGIQLTLKYKMFTLFAIGNGRMGYESIYSSNYYWVDGIDKYSEVVNTRWTPETASTATYPRLTSKTGSNNFQNSTYWLNKSNYFTLSRAQLTYDLPSKIFGSKSNRDASIYLRGSNLFMVSKDVRKRQLNVASEPQYINVALGVRILF